jgi:hypothetical protein
MYLSDLPKRLYEQNYTGVYILIQKNIHDVGMQVCKDAILNTGKAASLIHRCTLRPCNNPPIIYIR